MSLEEALAANTKALEANTAALSKIAGAAAAKAGAGATASKPAGAAAGATKAAGAAAKPAAKKAPTIEDIRTKFGGYLSVKDADVRETRKAEVQQINDYFGVAKASDLDPSNFAEALGYLAKFEAGEEVVFPGADEGTTEEEGGDESLV